MNLNTTFVVSAIQVVARAMLRRGCRDYPLLRGAPATAAREFRARRPPAPQPRAPVTPAWRGLLLVPATILTTAVERHRRGRASLEFHQANVIDIFIQLTDVVV